MQPFPRILCVLALHAAMGSAGTALAEPFVIELTIVDAHGWIHAKAPGAPNTPFTAPFIVVRATGDTDNVIATSATGTVYQGSTFGVSIPGVGSGSAPTRDLAVSVGAGSVGFIAPSYPSVFTSGAGALDAGLTDTEMHALGPKPVQQAYTYHWGPTSAMIGFTTDDGTTGTVAAGVGGGQGGTLEIHLGGSAPNPIAAKTYRALATFLAASGPTTSASFEEGNGASSGGVSFPGGLLTIVESLPVFRFPAGYLPEPATFWFGTHGSPTHFALNDRGNDTVGPVGFEAVFPVDVVATGFLFNCYACDAGPNQSGIVWTTLDAAGNPLEYGTVFLDFTAPAEGQARPVNFFGLTTTKPFRRLTLTKTYFNGETKSWVIDDLRYATALAPGAAPPPSATVPTLGTAALALVSLAVLLVGFVYSRKDANRARR